ncbi:c-type cytochrome [Methylolobus aquaticus]
MQPFKPFFVHGLIALAFLGGVGAIGAGLVVYFGLYNVAAVDQHTSPVYAVLDYALAQAIRQRAKGIEPPADLSDPSRTDSGFMLFRKHCVGCHGAPGIPPGDAGKGMLPHPTNLVESARGLRPEEIFWVVKNGIKMTGMPAWQFRFSDPEIWAIVAFLRELPSLSADEYRALEWEASSVVPLTAPSGSLR